MTGGLSVRIDGALVGRLWLDADKRFCFQYATEWLANSRIPLSLALPLRPEPYLADASHPFFTNLLPEERIRAAIARNLGISPNNDYGLLERLGGDCAGAVSLYPATIKSQTAGGSYQALSEDELAAIIADLPRRPLLAGESGIRLSLAGAQNKLPVRFDGNRFYLCHGTAASTHIIKPAIEGLDNSAVNEAYCMALARSIGLDVPGSFLFQTGETSFFVVERYDRVIADANVVRLHQEDFCQALGILPQYKYEAEGGPNLAACCDLLRSTSIRPGRDLQALIDWVIYAVLTGNCDAHAKNISLLLLDDGPRLAPFYDLISTRIYAHYGLTTRLAMKIGGEAEPTALRAQHWQRFAEEIGVKPKLILKRINDMAARVEVQRLQLFKGEFASYRCDALYRLIQLIGEQTERTRKWVG
ncbi:type II toxin-antitoxin system HipA family toxin [Trichlorobacter lovleyi]|uniref:type II toxin-antitoxin system HipA family toxin n=1 Tax=Trichlorobacter lovleyi TaxID=313985 RepID=UPI002480E4C3|nr:type II toxin-antitoxin system HipA family toxin [Trichlorobacter lovleyi]